MQFMNKFIAPVWGLKLNKPRHRKIAQKILAQSLINN